MFDPDALLPRINRGMIYLDACLLAGIRLARERQVNVRVAPTILSPCGLCVRHAGSLAPVLFVPAGLSLSISRITGWVLRKT